MWGVPIFYLANAQYITSGTSIRGAFKSASSCHQPGMSMIGALSSLGFHQSGISISGAGPSGVGGFGGGKAGRGLVGRGVPAVGKGLDGRKVGEA